MELRINIGIAEIINLIKQLPEVELEKLKAELEIRSSFATPEKEELKKMLMEAPVYKKEQVDLIVKTRKEINAWRSK